MTHGNTPGGEQDDPGWAPGQPPPPGYAPPGYAPPGYGPPPAYGPPAYGQPLYGQPGYGAPGYYPPGYGPPVYPPPGPKPPTYGGWAVTATVGGVLFSLLVGLPTAIVGITYGSKVTQLWARGDAQGAYSASRKARGWLTASTVFDLLGLILVAFLVITHVSGSPVNYTKPAVVPVTMTATATAVPAQQAIPAGMTYGCHGHLHDR